MNTATAKSPAIQATTSSLILTAISTADRTKTWVAAKAGIPLSTFLRKLGGHTDWTVGEVARVARALNVRPSTLLPAEFAAVTREMVAA